MFQTGVYPSDGTPAEFHSTITILTCAEHAAAALANASMPAVLPESEGFAFVRAAKDDFIIAAVDGAGAMYGCVCVCVYVFMWVGARLSDFSVIVGSQDCLAYEYFLSDLFTWLTLST